MTIPQLAMVVFAAAWILFASWVGCTEMRFHNLGRRLDRVETQSSLLNAAYQLEQKKDK